MSAAVTGNPQPLMVATAAAGVVPTTPAGEFTAKNTPGWSEAAAISAITATKLSSSIEPYPTANAWRSRARSFGVVPEEIKEWNPETAPQAMVMKQKGKILPAKMGPVPSTKRVKAGIFSSGRRNRIPTASKTTTPSFTKVLRYPRGASKSHTGRALEKNP